MQGLVEEPYLRDWSARLEITERPDTALAQAGLPVAAGHRQLIQIGQQGEGTTVDAV